MMNEREIRMRDLFWYIISHWRILIIIVVIGGIIGGAYSYSRSSNNTVEPEAQVDQLAEREDVKENELREAVIDMSPEEGAIVLGATLTETDINSIGIYYNYKELFEARKNNSENLEYMSMDPFDSYEGQYLYYIESGSQDSLDSLLATYKTKLNNLKESYGTLFEFTTKASDSDNPSLISIENVSLSNPTATLSVTVYGDSKETCESKLNEIDKYIIGIDKDIDSDIADHEIKKIADSCYKIQDSTIIDMQKLSVDALNTLNNNMNTVYNNLSEEAKAFVALVNANPELNWEDIIESIPDAKKNTEQADKESADSNPNTESKPSVSPKWVALGAVVGLVLVIIIMAIIYCSSGRIRFEDDFETLLNTPCLGMTRFGNNKKRFVLDRAIDRARYKGVSILGDSDSAEMIAANISVCASDKNAKKLWATGTSFNERGRKLAYEVSSVLKTKGIELAIGHSLFKNASEIEEMADADAIVLFENVLESKRADVIKAVKSCCDRGIKTIGLVVGQ